MHRFVPHVETRLADAIRAYRSAHRLTQAQFGNRIGATKGTVGNWERGGRPQSRFHETLCGVLELDFAEFAELLDGTSGADVVPIGGRGLSVGTTPNAAQRTFDGPASTQDAELRRDVISAASDVLRNGGVRPEDVPDFTARLMRVANVPW